MNPTERFVNAQEQLAQTQVAADERLTVLLVLASVAVGVAVVILGVQLLTLAYKQATLARVQDEFGRLGRRNDEVWALLQIVKGWAESARTHSKDAAATVKEVRQQSPAAEKHVIAEVRAVPEKTGEVVKRIMEDSDPFKLGPRASDSPETRP